jgi:hypothetical protein
MCGELCVLLLVSLSLPRVIHDASSSTLVSPERARGRVHVLHCRHGLKQKTTAQVFMFVPPITYFVVGNIWVTLLLFVITLGVLIALFFLKNTYPWNFYLLGAFTLFMGCMIATTCAVYSMHGMGVNVAVAAGITLFVFVGLTVFVQLSDIDFSFLGLFLPVCLLVFIFWMIAALLLGFSLGLLFGGIGVLLFSGFIIYDTWMIMNRMVCKMCVRT